jgi:hypothetical protein
MGMWKEERAGARVHIHLAKDFGSQRDLRAALRRLVDPTPLGISISGENAEAAFDLLLEVQALASTQPHVMTRLLDDPGFQDVEESRTALAVGSSRFEG